MSSQRPGEMGIVSRPARVSGALFLAAAAFQTALAAGAPWGAAAWGGDHHGTLPVGYRLGSAGSAAVLATLGLGVGGRMSDPRRRRRLLTGALGFAGLSAVMNARSPSAIERSIWTPYAMLQLGVLLVARRAESASKPFSA